jgi:hypothetical protein
VLIIQWSYEIFCFGNNTRPALCKLYNNYTLICRYSSDLLKNKFALLQYICILIIHYLVLSRLLFSIDFM